jgi:cytochrome c2
MARILVVLVLTALLAGCSGSSTESTQSKSAPPPSRSASEPAADATAKGPSKGVGPITQFTLGSVDPATAAAGKLVFETKCTACHKIDERYVGPPLRGVTTRRTPEWILNMVLNPEQMIKEDPEAKNLFAQFLTPMTFQNVTQQDAEAILAYLRSIDAQTAQ